MPPYIWSTVFSPNDMLPYLARTSLTFSISLGMSSWRRSLSDWAETADEAENWRAELERICCCQYVLRRDETVRETRVHGCVGARWTGDSGKSRSPPEDTPKNVLAPLGRKQRRR